jgi:hypothetical protein
MRLQLIQRVNTCGDREDGHSELLRGQNIVRRVADETDFRLIPEMRAGLLHRVFEDVVTELVAIAETADGEETPDAGSFEFPPADPLQVAGTNAEEFPSVEEGRKQFTNRWAQLRAKLRGIALHFVAHDLFCPGEPCLEAFAFNPALFRSGAQDADVGVAVNRYVVDSPITLIDVVERCMEGVVMHPITTVEQGAVYVEEVRIEIAPRQRV